MIRILHIISSLDTGGAETALINLTKGTQQDIEHTIFTFSPIHQRAQALKNTKVIIKSVSIYNILFLIAKHKPQINMGWLLHGTLFTLFAKLFFPKSVIVWNIRYSNLPNANLKTQIGIYVLKLFSKLPQLIIYNSIAGKLHHEKDKKYSATSSTVICNGFDTQNYQANFLARKNFLIDNNLPTSAFIIGMVARFDPYKNHLTYIQTALNWLENTEDSAKPIYFIFIGKGMDSTNNQLQDLIESHPCGKKIIFLGEQVDVTIFYQSMNIHCLFSSTEGFPNVIGESMACEVPNIATNVGDVKSLVDPSCGWLIAPGDTEALMKSWGEAYYSNTEALAIKARLAREHIVNNFSQEVANEKYKNSLKKILDSQTLNF